MAHSLRVSDSLRVSSWHHFAAEAAGNTLTTQVRLPGGQQPAELREPTGPPHPYKVWEDPEQRAPLGRARL